MSKIVDFPPKRAPQITVEGRSLDEWGAAEITHVAIEAFVSSCMQSFRDEAAKQMSDFPDGDVKDSVVTDAEMQVAAVARLLGKMIAREAGLLMPHNNDPSSA